MVHEISNEHQETSHSSLFWDRVKNHNHLIRIGDKTSEKLRVYYSKGPPPLQIVALPSLTLSELLWLRGRQD